MERIIPDADTIWGRLIEPHPAVTGEKRRSTVRLLSAFTLGLLLLDLLTAIGFFLVFGYVDIAIGLSAVLYPLAYLLSRSPRPRLGKLVVLLTLTGVITASLLNYGAETFIAIWFLAPTLVGVILLSMGGAIAFALLNISIPIFLTIGDAQASVGNTFSLVAFLIFTSVIALATKHTRERDQEKLEEQARALARSRAQYKQLFDDVPVGLFESTADGQLIQANQAMLQILGFPDRQALSAVKRSDLYVDPADREALRALMDEEGTVQDFETQLIRPDGEQIWVRERVRAVYDGEGEISSYRGSLEDVTEQKRLQQALAEEHEKLQLIIGAMPNILIVVDEKNRLTALYLPPGFPPILKRRWETSVERLVEVLPSELAERTRSSLEAVRQTGAGESFEQAVPSADGEQSRYLRVKLSPVTETNDVLIVVDDVTELKEAEEAVRAYADELELRNAELDAFSHTVAHDLRGPLNRIVGHSEFIRLFSDDELSPRTSEFLTRIEEAAFTMSDMIQGLLMLAQLRDSAEVVEPVDMSERIDAAIERIHADIEERGVHVDVAQSIPDALGYGPWLEEVFANLVGNAVKYIGRNNLDPQITIRGATQEAAVRYEVVDNGVGIAPEDQPHLFDMLTRFHKEQASGTGIGLSIVQRIVEKLGGEVGVESEPGEGSTFWFTLPAVPEEPTG